MLTTRQIENLESLSYLWERDGGWTICECHSRMYSVSVRFADPSGPNVSGLKRTRQWLPEFAELPPALAKARVGNCGTYTVGDFPCFAAHRLIKRGRDLGLELTVRAWDPIHCMPRHMDGTSPPIMDDEEEVEYVTQRMREAGRPVLTVEED